MAATDFYEHCNGWWTADPANTIPDEYASWGSFIQLHDKSLKTQVTLCGELAEAAESHEELQLARVWNASLSKFKQWSENQGDLTPISMEVERMETILGDGGMEGLAKYLARAIQIGVGSPLDFDKIPNLLDSKSMVLEIGPSGLSLPSRDYYFEPNFEAQRTMFSSHLGLVGSMLEFEPDFAERVLRFETKLATIQMTPSQSRNYDQYFTVTTLDKFISEVNSLNHFDGKLDNYDNAAEPEHPDEAGPLKQKDYTLHDQGLAEMSSFMETLYSELQLREALTGNFKKFYTDKGVQPAQPEEAEHRLLAFDGDYFRRVFGLLSGECGARNMADIRSYLKYKIVRMASEFCTDALDAEMFDFYGRKLGGQKERKSPEKRTVGRVNSLVGELLGKAYVARFFSEEDKITIKSLIDDVLEVMAVSLTKNDWLTQETKEKAQAKLSKFRTKIGYPDKMKSFEDLHLEAEDDLFTVVCKLKEFDYQKEFLDQINAPVDKEKWEMHPQQVNAYYHPLHNEIVFPAAILQPPFYSKNMDQVQFDLGEDSDTPDALTAINFGAIGAVIAHEITHGYDDQGRKFDADGNINDWWTEGDAELFKAKTDLMEKQAEQYEYKDQDSDQVHKMNGQLTMGENLADLGGMSLAVQAMIKRFGEENPAQLRLLFKSWANVWKSKPVSYTHLTLPTKRIV
eukprot:TRINITY_DN2098_c0_g2_i3.p1 TRINITY_DN2098_c0_g2~~TRINITY_DN2098_c0_g2_i3.p1  ORF type:complete len:684 (+),score=226.03 TRINITY_DN2098_c0_g2_i3:219-2270(+)